MEITIKYHGDTKPLERHGAAIDLSASETVEMKQGEVKIIPLGVSMKLPDGYFGFVAPRSSTCLKHGIMAANSVGIIENEYCGNNDIWGFVAFATRDTTIEEGTRIAQFFVLPEMGEVTFREVESMPYVDRGGYGSTGTGTEPKFIDADGNELKVGDTVYIANSETLKKVIGLETYENDFLAVLEDYEKKIRTRIFCSSVHIASTSLGVDNEPIRVGEVLFLNEGGLQRYGSRFKGMPFIVLEVTRKDFRVWSKSGNFGHFHYFETCLFTRKKPEGVCNE